MGYIITGGWWLVAGGWWLGKLPALLRSEIAETAISRSELRNLLEI
jgi:hypothetical protein